VPYLWRKLTPDQRDELLAYRRLMRRPWHRPPHFGRGFAHYVITAACFEHRPIIGSSPARMAWFSEVLLKAFMDPPSAWCVLPNHYHVLARIKNLKGLTRKLGRFHGRVSRKWNLEDDTLGRQLWHGVSDRAMRNGDHFWATVNYVHHNPVKHGYADKWEDWPFSSAADYLGEMGRGAARKIWDSYPPGEYGKGWDDDPEEADA